MNATTFNRNFDFFKDDTFQTSLHFSFSDTININCAFFSNKLATSNLSLNQITVYASQNPEKRDAVIKMFADADNIIKEDGEKILELYARFEKELIALVQETDRKVTELTNQVICS